MLRGERMGDGAGNEVVLFPFEYLYMSQDEGGDYSHSGTYNIDFLGWDANGRVLECPYYAPCTLECIGYYDTSSNDRIYQSIAPVHLANGSINYLTLYVAHDNHPPHVIGEVIIQGELLGYTGTAGQVTGDHLHTCVGQGTYDGFTTRPGGHQDLTNRIHYWDACYVNDTVIVQGYNHNWITYQGGVTPGGGGRKSSFPWVLYARRKREKMSS